MESDRNFAEFRGKLGGDRSRLKWAPLPPDEARRLDVLRSYGILDTPPEPAFDDVALLAAYACRTPIALVTLIDEEREWFKARVGIELKAASREGFCAHTILGRDLLVVPDARLDPRFAENPYVTGPPGVRFYAGAPLITPEGPVIGTLSVLDVVPRTLEQEEAAALVRLARQVQTHLELRRALLAARRAEESLRGCAERSRRHQQALLDLTRACLATGTLEESLRRVIEGVAHSLGVERVNVWRFNADRTVLGCVSHFQSSTGGHSSGMELRADAHPRYFEALRTEPVIVAHDARTDPRTSDLTAGYLLPLGIGSLLDVPIYAGGMLEGVLCQEHVGSPRTWTEDEKLLSMGLANLISLAIEQDERRRVERDLATSEEKRLLAEEAARGRTSFERLVGKSHAMQEVYRKIRLAAQSDVTVLLSGESGTGKELAASAVHSLSERRGKPFVAVNCSAIPEGLLESELFGHVKGAFTGAVRDKVGLFQAAEGGTLFLDEVGEMSPALQVKVLRALQEREIRRVGDERVSKVDARIVAATNRDLGKMVEAGKLREDFYYRIRVFDIVMPPLRDRREDIPLLVRHFLNDLAAKGPRRVQGPDSEALRILMNYAWPGNVRELRNAIEHALVTATGTVIQRADLPADLCGRPASAAPTLTAEQVAERERVVTALSKAGGNRTRAAALLGMSRVTLWKKMRLLGLDGRNGNDATTAKRTG